MRVAAATPFIESLFVVPAEEPEPARILGMSFVRRQIQSQHLSAGDFVEVVVRRSPLFYSAQHAFRPRERGENLADGARSQALKFTGGRFVLGRHPQGAQALGRERIRSDDRLYASN